MNILGLIEIRGDAQLGAVGTDIAEGRMDGFLHHVSQITGELQLAGALHHVHLNLKGLSPHTGPGQAGNQPHLVRARQAVRQELTDTQELLHIGGGNGNALQLRVAQQLHIRLAADIAYRPLQITHAGFPGVALNDFPNGILGDAKLGFFQAMSCNLLGHQMVFGNHQLLLIGIGAELDNLHPV